MTKTERCPHCASPKIASGICFACGRSLIEPVEFPRLEGLEPTHHVDREKREEPQPAKLRCLACGVPNPETRALCLACGERL